MPKNEATWDKLGYENAKPQVRWVCFNIRVTKALCVYLDESDKPHAIYNPKIMLGLAAFKTEEGCLTRPEDQLSKVTRYDHMKLAFDELVDGELKHRKRDFAGWEAQMIQHMVDHCKGKLV